MPPSTARFVNGLLAGQLEDRLRTMRADGWLSYAKMAELLNADLPGDCAIDAATVRRYMREYGIENDSET